MMRGVSIGELTTARFLELLASSDPVPAGGCAAAFAGAQGASLVAMMARVALRRADQEEVAARLEQAASAGDRLAQQLLVLAGQDADAYNQVMRAYRLPRGTEKEKEARSEAIRQALSRAADVPLATIKTAVAALEVLVDELLPLLPPSVLPDAGTAGWLLRACVEAASLNVRANWQSMRPSPTDGWERLESLVGQSRRLFDRVRSRLGPLSNGGVPAGTA